FNELPTKASLRARTEGPGRPRLTVGPSVNRGAYDGWAPVADIVRRLADLARYAHPRYEEAPALRGRMSSRILKHFSKGLKFAPERVFVWNEAQRQEAVELHGIPADHVFATGAQLFDEWFERRPSGSQEEFVRQVGLDPRLPYVAYVASSSFITQTGNEPD